MEEYTKIIKNQLAKETACRMGKMVTWKHWKTLGFVSGLICSFLVFDTLIFRMGHRFTAWSGAPSSKLMGSKDGRSAQPEEAKIMYERLVTLASEAVSKDELQNNKLWEEPNQASLWKPCADKVYPEHQGYGAHGFILVTADGGVNQQRVAVCNAVTAAVLLNATLVLPKFLYSSVWKDSSQFSDIYQEEHFIDLLKDDVHIVRELPSHLRSIDIEAMGGQLTDMDIVKEPKPTDFVGLALPLLRKHGVVHFLGFAHRLGFDPLSTDLQRLRCRCNFRALKFVPRIQETGALLVRRMRKYNPRVSKLDAQLLGEHVTSPPKRDHDTSSQGPLGYLALHMRFEIDMVAYSQCDFGGGEKEREELQAYREIHFPILALAMKKHSVSPSEMRKLGSCPLTPEEAALMLAALGYKSRTYIYIAGSRAYGGQSRMLPFTKLYPNSVRKEDLLTPSELAPFKNFSSQLAALDFIACATADVFAMTDSGSQFASLVSGYRIYHGEGRLPTLQPKKNRFAKLFAENGTIGWDAFKKRVKEIIDDTRIVRARRWGKSIYRQPRTPGCMCKVS